MKFKTMLLLELAVPALVVSVLSGCFIGGGGGPTYDGVWTAVFVDSAFTPPAAASGASVVCSLPNPLPTVTLVNGVGSTSQTNTCINTATGTQNFIYLISVAVTTATGAVSAVVNGTPLSGQCISAVGCAAQGGTASLSLTR